MSFDIDTKWMVTDEDTTDQAEWSKLADIPLRQAHGLKGVGATSMGQISFLKSAGAGWELEAPRKHLRHFIPAGYTYELPRFYPNSVARSKEVSIIEAVGSQMFAAAEPADASRVVGFVSPYLLAAEAARDRFESLMNDWQRDTMFSSSTHDLVLHPAYQQIVGMGRQAAPLILERIEELSAPWFPALIAIAGEDAAADASTAKEAAQRWLDWGAENDLTR